MINYVIISILVFVYYFIIIFLCGTLFLKKIKAEYSLPFALVIGCFLYFISFNLVALPMKLSFQPLLSLTLLWGTVVGIAFILIVFCNKKYLINVLQMYRHIVKENLWLFIGLIILFLIQYIYIGSHTGWSVGVTDDMYYIGDVSTSVYTNTIQQYHYLTGTKYSELIRGRILQMYTVHSAVVCQLTGLPPLIENKWPLAGMWLMLIDCVYFLWGKLLFKGNNKKCFIFMGAVTWIVLCQSRTVGFFAMELVYRTSEGKNLLANLIIPFLFYLFARVVMLNSKKQDWYAVFITVTCSFCLVMSSMFILPFVMASFYGTYILLGKRWEMIVPALICFLPCVLVLGIYLLSQKGILVFPIP